MCYDMYETQLLFRSLWVCNDAREKMSSYRPAFWQLDTQYCARGDMIKSIRGNSAVESSGYCAIVDVQSGIDEGISEIN